MLLPNFVIMGVQKAGTTSIYNYLKQHPQIYMSPVKEPHFLQDDWQTENADEVSNLKKKKKVKVTTLEDYAQLFANVTDEIAIGEASPNCLLHHRTSIPQILKYIPTAKLIAILRNPVDRAYSDYLMNAREGKKTTQLMVQAKERSQESHVIRKGFYYEALQDFYAHFDLQQIKVFLYDDLQKDSVHFMQEMYHFLEVDATYSPDIHRVSQKGQVPKNKAVNRFFKQPNTLRLSTANTLKQILPNRPLRNFKKFLINLNMESKDQHPLSQAERQVLLDLYRPDIIKLQDLIQRDLSAWLDASN